MMQDDRKEDAKKRKMTSQPVENEKRKLPTTADTQLVKSTADDKNEKQKLPTTADTQLVNRTVEDKNKNPKMPTTADAQKVANEVQIESSSSESTIARIDFKVNEVVWAKIKGSVHWPAKIKSFPSSKMVIVVWFNDYRTTKIYRTQLFKFLQNFDLYAQNFDNTVGLKTAAYEGLMYLGNSFANQ